MPNIKVLEIVSGLGLGGAEKALISRLKYEPSAVESTILNIRPQIDSLKLPDTLNYLENSGNFLQKISYMNRKVRELKPNIVIVRTPADVIRLAMIKTFFLTQIYLVFEAHSNFVTKKKYFRRAFEILFSVASSQLNLIIAVSEAVKNGPLCRSKAAVKVCYLGSDITIGNVFFDEADKVKFLFIGRMVDVKRPLWLIERVDKLRSRLEIKEHCLTIVGSGPLLEKAKDLVLARGLSDYILFAGEQSDVVPYLLKHNYLVSCSENEGLPITFYEAKLAGLRIIATPSGGGQEICNENDFVTLGFSEDEFEDVLFKALTGPIPSKDERIETSSASAWMSAEVCANSYYKTLLDSFESGDRE